MAASSTLSQLPSQSNSSLSLKKHFRTLKDPRRRHRRLHHLLDIIIIAICAVICGANGWPEIATFARRRRQWLKRFLALPNGIPSHDTFERVFDRIDPYAFQACFRQWITAVCQCLDLRHVAIDGKTLRRSGSATLGPLHVVSAWATANHLALGAVAVPEKTNEIKAIPQLLELLDLHGTLVTIDAMGCQKAIAQKIIDQGGDYLLTVKDNQEHLLEDIQQCFIDACERDLAGVEHDTFRSEEHGHGRYEKRTYTIIRRPQGIRNLDAWAALAVVGMCYSERTVNGATSEESRYFIGSKPAGARYYGKALRHHWGIENGLHWQMDLTFKEDASRIRKRRGAENFALLRRLALSLLKQHPDKSSIACKRLAAALDTDFLEEILRGDGSSGNE